MPASSGVAVLPESVELGGPPAPGAPLVLLHPTGKMDKSATKAAIDAIDGVSLWFSRVMLPPLNLLWAANLETYQWVRATIRR